jgi:hypothetical protein
MVLADEKVSLFTYEYIILYLGSEKVSDKDLGAHSAPHPVDPFTIQTAP